MRKLAAYTLVALLAVASALPARAEEPKPVAVISLASYQKVLDAADSVAKLAGIPMPVSQSIEMPIMQRTGGKGIVGLDKTKPWGVVLLSPDPSGLLIIVPAADAKAFLAGAVGGSATTQDESDGTITATIEGKPMHVKGAGGWLFASPNAANLKDLPADPTTLLGDLPQHYTVAVRIMPQNVPAQARQKLWDTIANMPGSTPAIHTMIAGLKTFAEQAKEVTIGLGVDAAAGKLSLEVTSTALSGSPLATVMQRFQDRTTSFSGLRSNEAVISSTTRIEGPLTPKELEDLKSNHEAALKRGLAAIDENESLADTAKPVAKEVLSTVLSVWFDTVKSGKQDMGMAVFTAPKPMLVIGGYLTDGEAIGAAIKKIVGVLGAEGAPPIKWDAEKYKGHSLHVMELPVPPGDAARTFGDKVEIVLAIGKESVWLAAGNDATARIKQVMDAPPIGAGPAVAGIVRVRPILDVVVQGAPPQAAMQIKQLSGQLAAMKPGSDEITWKSTPIKDGVTVKLEINQGVISAIGEAGMMFMMRGNAGGPPPGAFGPGGPPPGFGPGPGQ